MAMRTDVPSGSIKLHGWAAEFLKTQEEGLTGNPQESGFPFNTGMWTESMNVRDREYPLHGSDWWPYEQTAYYLDGALRCGHILKSEQLLARVRENISHIAAGAAEDGRLRAGDIEDDSWPMVVIMRMLFEAQRHA